MVTIHHQDAVTLYAAYVIYHTENILKLCKITYKVHINIYIYIYSNCHLTMNSYLIRNM